MSTETVPEAQHWLRYGTESMRLRCDDILALGDCMTYADRVDMRDEASATTGWRRHWHRVLKQHHDLGWPIPEAWEDYRAYDIALNNWCAMINGHLGMTVPIQPDPKPRVDRILKPGEMTNTQKIQWWVSGGLFVLVTAFAVLLNAVDTESYSSDGGTPFNTVITLAYLFWAAMTVWWMWAGKYEKTHPKFKAARVVAGTAGAAVLAKKAYDSHRRTEERLASGDY